MERPTPVPPESRQVTSSGMRKRPGADLGLKPHQHLVTADRTIRDLKRELLEAKRALEAHGDDLERATTEALRIQAEMVTLKNEIDASHGREAESARQWIAMSAELGEVRTKLERYERVLKRVRERAAEGELREVIAILDLHTPDEER